MRRALRATTRGITSGRPCLQDGAVFFASNLLRQLRLSRLINCFTGYHSSQQMRRGTMASKHPFFTMTGACALVVSAIPSIGGAQQSTVDGVRVENGVNRPERPYR